MAIPRLSGHVAGTRVIKACRPFHWRDRYPKVNMPPPELWAEAKKKWGYLLK